MSTDKPLDQKALADDHKEELPEGTGQPPLTIALTDEELLALCKDRVCSACSEKSEADDQRLRTLAEMDNFKKRITREKEDFLKYAAEGVLADLTPVLDNLDLALEHGASVEACKGFLVGVDMTRKVFLDVLAKHGLVPVGVRGEAFDPARHEALGYAAAPELPEGVVAQVVGKGYLLKERLLRPAKVLLVKNA